MSVRPIDGLEVAAYTIPTDAPESDGTLAWDATTMVCVHATAGGERGFGYTYGHAVVGDLIGETLAPAVVGRDAMDLPGAWQAMVATLRNVGRPGIGSSAVSAVDVALWDLKARLLGVPLASLMGRVREAVPIYGSGGFTSYDDGRLREQLGGWADAGIGAVKMKVGREPGRDAARVAAARDAVGPETVLMVDANGAYERQQALAMAARFAEQGVTWFEEPVSSDDLAGLRLVRDGSPPGVEITAGEYGYDAWYFRHMLDAGAVDVLQADATRCGGFTGFLAVARQCEARSMPLSSHTAPALHLAACCAAPAVRHMEYFHDHVRIESMLLDHAPSPQGGCLAPDPTRPGLGFDLDESAARPYRTGDDRWRR